MNTTLELVWSPALGLGFAGWKSRLRFLIIDDDADVQRAARLALAAHAARIETASSPDAIKQLLPNEAFECVLLDMNFALGEHSGRAGMDGLEQIKSADPTLSVILMTAYGAVSIAVDALKRGAVDFILKPWRNETLVASMLSAVAQTRAQRRGDPLELDALERTAIEKALARHDGNIAQAAATLGLSRPALYRRMSKHGL